MTTSLTVLGMVTAIAGLLLAARYSETRRLQLGASTFRLVFPAEVEAEAVERLLASLTGLLLPWWRRLLAQPAVFIETRADAEGIAHYLTVPPTAAGQVTSALQAHLPGVRSQEAELPPLAATVAAEYTTTTDNRPLRCDPAALSADLLANLQPLQPGEVVAVQWALTAAAPVRPPRLPDKERRNAWTLDNQVVSTSEGLTALRSKQREALILGAGRIAVQAPKPRAVQLLRQVEAPWHASRAPGVQLRRRLLPHRMVARRVEHQRPPVLVWPALLNIEEGAGVIGWPIGVTALPGLALGGCRLLPASGAIPTVGTVLGFSTFPGEDGRPVAVDEAARLRHVAVTGPTGVGKSTLLTNMVVQDAIRGLGVVVIDPKGDLVDTIAERLPESRLDDVIVLDPADDARPVGYNPLSSTPETRELVVEQVLGVMRSIWQANWGPRTDDILRGCLLSLSAIPKLTLTEVPALLTDEAFRRRVLAHVDDHTLHRRAQPEEQVDRLARNRADDVMINLQLQQFGASLVSCSENIDETPSGKLLHGIMASIAEFYSRNLATESIKGMTQKAQGGGTIAKAPIGYRNAPAVVDGREFRTVVMDPDRAPLIAWAFEAYATGEWTLQGLLKELTTRGLTTVPTRTRQEKPLALSRLHALLRNRYYLGKVTFRGVEYAGSHPPLVSLETFDAVQTMLDRNRTGEKEREHPHYLRSTVYCGQCGSRLCYTQTTNRHGTTYRYFFCVGRHQRRTACTQSSVSVSLIEKLVEHEWASIRIDPKYGTLLQEVVQADLGQLEARNDSLERRVRRQLQTKREQRKKLLDAYYAGAIAIDVLKEEQLRLTKELEDLEMRLVRSRLRVADLELALRKTLEFLHSPQETYLEAPEPLRRLLNQAVWEKVIVEEEGEAVVYGEVQEPFATLLDAHLLEPVDNKRTLDHLAEGSKDVDLVTPRGRHSNKRSPLEYRLKDGGLAAPTGFEPVSPP